MVTSALPYFWVGLLLILVFSVWTSGLLPSDFNYDSGLQPAFTPVRRQRAAHALLPAATILITSIGGWILTMRNNMITTLAEDYVRMGRAKGLSNRRIMIDYAARNALLPNLSGFAMSLGFVISGAILVEYVFNYPGLGYLLYNAVQNTDYPLMQALFMLFTVAVLVAVLVCDFAIAWLDPRARAKGVAAMTALLGRHLRARARPPAPVRAPRRRPAGAPSAASRKAMVGLVIFLVFCVLAAACRGLFTSVHDPNALRVPAGAAARPASTGSARPRSARTSAPSSSTAPGSRWSSRWSPGSSPRCSRSWSACRPPTSAASPTTCCPC